MTATFRIVLATSSLWIAASSLPIYGRESLIGTLHSTDVSLAEFDSTHLKLVAHLTLVPARTATLNNVELCSFHLNGMPVFAEPLGEEIELHKGVPVDLPPIYVTILMRDVHSVEPLREMVESQSVHVPGTLVANMKLSFTERLALRTQHPRAEVGFDQNVAVNTVSEPFARASVLAVLNLVQAGMDARRMVENYGLQAKPAWIQELSRQAKSDLFAVESSYKLEQDGESYPIVMDQFGFRCGPAAVIATAEVDAPWMYDAEFLTSHREESRLR